MSKYRRVATLFGIVVLFGFIAGILGEIFLDWDGWFRARRYERMLESLPESPGYLLDTNFQQTISFYPLGLRSFTIEGEYAQTVSFFKTELPKAGWVLSNSEEYGSSTTMQFTNESDYCLKMHIAEGSRLDDEIYVSIEIWDNIECNV